VKVLVLNCGSSSIKYQVIETSLEAIEQHADREIVRGSVERIGSSGAVHALTAEGGRRFTDSGEFAEHRDALAHVMKVLTHPERGVLHDVGEIDAIGHRVVHGGEHFTQSVLATPEALRAVEECIPLAPLHNPANLRGIEAAARELPGRPQALVFDTAYHQTMPPHAFLYALPYTLYTRHGVRRYGFHGISHRFVGWRAQALLGRPRSELKLVTCHLGNGASVCAIDHGRSVDTSMGLTPLEGLVMGTRPGDLDPGAIFHTMHVEELDERGMTSLLNRHSGLYGLSGVSNDMRELLAEEARGHERAKLAIEVFCYRLRKYVAAYAGAMGGVDAVLLTGGIGENAPSVRERALAGLEFMGLSLDSARNAAAVGREAEISAEASRVKALVIPTNEELIIARDTVRLVAGVPQH
jgi:acetate kinase